MKTFKSILLYVLILAVFVLIYSLFPHKEADDQEPEEIDYQDKYYESLEKYDSVFDEINSTMSYVHTIDDYFEDNTTVPSEVIDAWNSLYYILHSYY